MTKEPWPGTFELERRAHRRALIRFIIKILLAIIGYIGLFYWLFGGL